MVSHLFIFFVVILMISCPFSQCINPFSWVYCRYKECCDKTWMNHDLFGLRYDLKNNLFGQHLAQHVVFKTIKAHLSKENPPKALVLSFNGITGSGKTHVSNIIMKNIFKKGVDSKYVAFYSGTRDFPFPDQISNYKKKLQKEVEYKLYQCGRSIFVFDQVDSIPPGVLDVLIPYLDYHTPVRSTDYRKSIFIFLSHAGANKIKRVASDFWAKGKVREDITLKDLEHDIRDGAFTDKGGLQYSEIVTRGFIDVYVPFLPLEKKHIKECIKTELKRRSLRGDVDKIADLFEYFPPGTELFSRQGCKHVHTKVDILAD